LILDKSLIVKLTSGLGNQLFQLANGLEQSMRLNAPLICETSTTDGVGDRQYALSALEQFLEFSSGRIPKELLSKSTPAIFREVEEFSWDESVNRVTIGTLLMGYFQNSKYQENSFPILMRHLTSIRMNRLGLEDTGDSCHIHVRRGDYETNPTIRKKIGLLSLGYYIEAIRLVEASGKQLNTLHIFTDSPEKVHKIFSKVFYNKKVMLHKESTDPLLNLIDLSTNSTLIAANSTFSWWAANLLQSNDSKAQVVFPSQVIRTDPRAQVLLNSKWSLVKSTWC